MVYVGPHISITKGFTATVEHALSVGANAFQIFTKSPQSTKSYKREVDEKDPDVKKAKTLIIQKDLMGFVHAQYTINLVNNPINSTHVKSLINDLEICSKLNLQGVIIHCGSNTEHKDDPNAEITKRICYILEKTKDISPLDNGSFPKLIIENQVKSGNKITTDLDEIGDLVRQIVAVNPEYEERIGICIDTQHLSTTKIYNFKTSQGVEHFLSDFDSKIGMYYLTCFHLNDAASLTQDRHEELLHGLLFAEEHGGKIEGLVELVKFANEFDKALILENSGRHSNHALQIAIIREFTHDHTGKDLLKIIKKYYKDSKA